MQFQIGNMTCGGCVRGVTTAIRSVDARAEVTADLDRRTVTVRTTQPRETLAAALADAGFVAA